ncbi:MAG TPA: FliH/SctL family protein [Candidatus Deferrimicrobium sp.]|nr:FliH/SctL family protein [Candidatus Deferrimicrobium sp.]
MSKLIRRGTNAPAVSIGDSHLDLEREAQAEQQLGYLFPGVSVRTNADGAKLIPIQEVFKIERVHCAERDKALQTGLEEGYRKGLNQGRAEGRAQSEQILRQFDGAIRDAIAQRETLLNEARQKILELVLQISRKVTFNAVAVDPEATLAMIGGVIDSLIDRSRLKIKVHPDHLPIVEQNIAQLMAGAATIKEIAVEADPRVRYGGCLIETPGGDIDARLESQFEVIQEAMLADEAQR